MIASSPGRWVVLLAAAISSCTTVLGIDKDYYEATGGAGGDASTGSGGGTPAQECNSGDGVCLATIPAPWMPTYFSVASTPVGVGPASCKDQSVPSRFYEVSTTPADCSECTCGSPSITCSAAFKGWEDSSCTGVAFDFNAGDGVCTNTGSALNGIQTLTANSTVTCQPSAVMPTPGDLWAEEHSVCAAAELPAGTCEIGTICVENAGLPICIQAEGDVAACPAGWEAATRHQYYLDAVDNRGCNPCSCAPPAQNLCAGGTYEIFDDASCATAASGSTTENDPCVPAINSAAVKFVAPPLGGAMCTVGGGQPNGSVTGTVAVTLCCRG
jgi:hypothetical protein